MREKYCVQFDWGGTYHGATVKDGTYLGTIVAKGEGDKKARRYEGSMHMLK